MINIIESDVDPIEPVIDAGESCVDAIWSLPQPA